MSCRWYFHRVPSSAPAVEFQWAEVNRSLKASLASPHSPHLLQRQEEVRTKSDQCSAMPTGEVGVSGIFHI